jgi:hypothetical protein
MKVKNPARRGIRPLGEEGFEQQRDFRGKSSVHPQRDAESAAAFPELNALVRKWPRLSGATRRAILAVAEVDGDTR